MNKLIIALSLFIVAGCTENSRAKAWGGSMTERLPCGQKLFDVTWKESSLWYATRVMRSDESPETYTFVEESGFGLVEGKVTFIECR